jgi:hypothetical protein
MIGSAAPAFGWIGRIITGILREWLTVSPRQMFLPLLQKSVGLENVEAGKAYDATGKLARRWLALRTRMRNVSVAEISPTTRLDQLVG